MRYPPPDRCTINALGLVLVRTGRADPNVVLERKATHFFEPDVLSFTDDELKDDDFVDPKVGEENVAAALKEVRKHTQPDHLTPEQWKRFRAMLEHYTDIMVWRKRDP